MLYSILNKNSFNEVSLALSKIDYNVALVHSDIFYGFKFHNKLSRQQLLEAHWEYVKNMIGEQPVWMPAFNYDFPKTQQFDVANSKSQVGVLPEYFRTKIAKWRSGIPIFSFCGNNESPAINYSQIIDPFDETSLFHTLVKNNGVIIYYGINLICSTILHYCERVSGNLTYRYDKFFPGKIIHGDGVEENVVLKYHVRPKNHFLEYDWEMFENDLIKNGVLQSFDSDGFHIKIIKALPLVEYWITKIKEDNLSLLNQKTREWVLSKLNELGRAFELSDFE
jgi:aminoglycoside N3'-acetyltransferase